MTRPCLIVLAAVIAAGCRSSQPTTNPFLRTTVPPPGTGQAAVVTPGEPYYPGSPPPATVDPTAPPPIITTPPPAGPAVAPPAGMPLRNNKYSPPGGSYIYNQSSVDRLKPGARDDGSLRRGNAVARAAITQEPRSLDDLVLPSVADAVEQATKVSAAPDTIELADYQAQEYGQAQEHGTGGDGPKRRTAARPSVAAGLEPIGTYRRNLPAPGGTTDRIARLVPVRASDDDPTEVP